MMKPKPALEGDARKRAAAEAATPSVKDGMVLGLGTGSTVQFALEDIARRVKGGLRVLGIPTSKRTEEESRRLGIPLTNLDEHPDIDVTIDGADEVDPKLNLIKGGGAALLREKVVAASSKRVLIIADESKFVQKLGSTFPVPVEVTPFARNFATARLTAFGSVPTLRTRDGKPVVTDNGNWILDARFPHVADPRKMDVEINNVPGIVASGIFVGLAHQVFLAGPTGVRRIDAP